VKEEKIQIFRENFEKLKMREDEVIVAYVQLIDEKNTLEGLGEPVEINIVV